MEILNTANTVVNGKLEDTQMTVVGGVVPKKTGYVALTLEDAEVNNVQLIGDKEVNAGDVYCGMNVTKGKNNKINQCEVSNFGGYGVVTSIGTTDIRIPISYKILTKLDDTHIHLNSLINIAGISQFELGYTMDYMGYNYCNGRQYTAVFYSETGEQIAEVPGRQYDKVSVPEGAKLVDFIIEQSYVPTTGNTDFNGAVLFITDYSNPSVEISNNKVFNNMREDLAICGGENVSIHDNKITDTWIGLCIEDGWEMCNHVLIENNTFNNNGRDVVVASGRNLEFIGNVFEAWVSIGNRVEGLKFMNNTFDISDENHKKTNDRFECTFHNTEAEIAYNIYKQARIAFGTTSVPSNVNIHNEHYIDSYINQMPKEYVIKDSIVEYKKHDGRINGAYLRTEISADNARLIYFVSTQCEDGNIHDIGRILYQKDNKAYSTSFTNVGIEIDNGYKDGFTEYYGCDFTNVTFALNGASNNATHILAEECSFNLNKELIEMWNINGSGVYTFKNCAFNITEDIEYLVSTVHATAAVDNYKIIFENCVFNGKNIGAIANAKLMPYVIVK